ncbi:hypothetical protein Sango_0142500 [Sesamum angolense]|uniref:Uncharacterized protein n=1 Tax=Sesamum angolense TaxID=2727404 RepID=A0AAE1XF47_9LAMI|nr:hypothetical protein Sango_0142500 [Sesamum angolense]
MKENISLSPKPTAISFSLSLLFLSLFAAATDPVPTPWPLQFHSILFMNNTKGLLQVVDLWYDWPNGRNFNIIQNQLGKKLYDLEWDNGTSYYYTLDANKECKIRHFPVGILRPNWLDGATYLGQVYRDGFLCNVWEKVDFIGIMRMLLPRGLFPGLSFQHKRDNFMFFKNCKTLDSSIPRLRELPSCLLSWSAIPSLGMIGHVMTFEVGQVLDDPNWQAPVYCFEGAKQEHKAMLESPFEYRGLVTEFLSIPMVI